MFNLRKTGLISGLLLIGLQIVLVPAVAHAQAVSGQNNGQSTVTRPPLSLTTSPIPLSIVTKPGQTITADLRVKNNSTQTEKLRIDLLKFGASGESGNPQLHEREAKDTYFDWVSFSEPTFTAEPNVWKTVKMTIKTPPSAAFGYYLAVLFSRATPDKPTGGTSAVEGGVASLVLLDVEAPGAKRQAKVASFTSTRKVYEFLPADLNMRLTNNGNIHVAPTGTIFIKRGNAQVGVLDFNTQRGNILPGTSRTFTASWSDGFPSYEDITVQNKTMRHLKWDLSRLQKFRIGRYTATLVAVYDDGQRDVPVEATVSFWVIPWRILGVVLLIVLLIGVAIWLILRSIWKNLHRRPQDIPPSAAPIVDAANKPEVATTEPLQVVTADTDSVTNSSSVDDALPKTSHKTNKTKKTDTATIASSKTQSTAAENSEPTTAPELKD